ncbi:MAG: hypothetical protein VKK04_15350 [Synechococcales bacterium]|nr:hypothetical protein [Synechococcales bacterium]
MVHSARQSVPEHHQSRLAQWVERTLNHPDHPVRWRLRGNILHLLYEGDRPPLQENLLPNILTILKATDPNTLVSPGYPPIYQVWCYGRTLGQPRPDWTVPIHLHHLHQAPPVSESPQAAGPEPSLREFSNPDPKAPLTHPPLASDALATASDLAEADRQLAQKGDPEAIARYLSRILSQFGVAVSVQIKLITRPHAPHPHLVRAGSTSRRLWVTCRASYSPAPNVIAEPVARHLRELSLDDLEDAVVVVQVNGEQVPDWMLRIDLTPSETVLREWASWGDVEAIHYLLNQTLGPYQRQIKEATLKETTLHLTCGLRPPVQGNAVDGAMPWTAAQARAILDPLLEAIAPQGIQAAVLYSEGADPQTPDWVEWFNLPASRLPERAILPYELAGQGNWEALTFLLGRLLNLDLGYKLATGGIRVQVLHKGELLHIMCDALICPEPAEVNPKVAYLLNQLKLPDIAGARIYGRRAGQRSPRWSHGIDFVERQRLVPEPSPEFAATDAYVSDLLTPSDGPVFRPDVTSAEVWAGWRKLRQGSWQRLRRSLLRSQLFVPTADTPELALPQSRPHHPDIKTALVWGAVGLLALVQLDLGLGQVVRQISQSGQSDRPTLGQLAPPPAPGQSQPLQPVPEGTSPEPVTFAGEDRIFGSSSFIEVDAIATAATAEESEIVLESPYPSFNSEQLDLKLALYHQHLLESGPPDVLVLGSSRAMRGIDPVVLEQKLADLGYPDVDVFNFGINGATAQVVELILRRILQPNQLPDLILWADGARAFNGGRVDLTYNGIATSEGYGLLAGGQIDVPTPLPDASDSGQPEHRFSRGWGASLAESYQTLDEWLSDRLAQISTVHTVRDRLKAWVQRRLTALFPPSPSAAGPFAHSPENAGAIVEGAIPLDTSGNRVSGMIDMDGFLPLEVYFDPATYYQRYARVPGNYDRDYANFQMAGAQFDALLALVDLGQQHGVPVVFVNMPLTSEYLDSFRLGYEEDFRQHLLELNLQREEFIFRDLGQVWLDQPEYHRRFSDPSHLNQVGAVEVSQQLAQDPLIPWSLSVDDAVD